MKTRYVVAVSGGVDSVVLLHMLSQSPDLELIVAHFDHGIRETSADDAAFVESLAKTYNHPFVTKREELGKQASEELARDRRYAFLRDVAKQYDAQIVTAHHADDAVETVAINLKRGTGWRGLAVLDSDIRRPLIGMSKNEIIAYAHKYNLEWHDDETNDSDVYLRNRIRRQLSQLDDDTKRQILGLRAEQIELKDKINAEVEQCVGKGPQYDRYFFIYAQQTAALECLRFVTDGQLTRPQLTRALLAIKINPAGTQYQAGSGILFRFTSRNFEVELIK